MSKQLDQFIELTSEQVQQLQRKKEQAKLIKPIIQDDRNKTKPNFVNKDQNDQHDKKNHTNGDNSQVYSNKGQQSKKLSQKNRQNKQTKRQEYKQKIDKNVDAKSNRNQSIQQITNTKPLDALKSQQFKEQDYIIKQLYEQVPQVINQINIVGKSNLTEIHSELKYKLKQFDFVVIKGTGVNIIKALQVAQNISRDFPQFKRINIPSTTIVKNTYTPKYKNQGLKQFTQKITKATIAIELSLNQLDSRHMGYQQVKINQRNDQKYSNEGRQRKDVERKRFK